MEYYSSMRKKEILPFVTTWMCLKKIFFPHWRLIALQYCVGLCHTSAWISHRYTYVPSLLNLLPTSPNPLASCTVLGTPSHLWTPILSGGVRVRIKFWALHICVLWFYLTWYSRWHCEVSLIFIFQMRKPEFRIS